MSSLYKKNIILNQIFSVNQLIHLIKWLNDESCSLSVNKSLNFNPFLTQRG